MSNLIPTDLREIPPPEGTLVIKLKSGGSLICEPEPWTTPEPPPMQRFVILEDSNGTQFISLPPVVRLDQFGVARIPLVGSNNNPKTVPVSEAGQHEIPRCKLDHTYARKPIGEKVEPKKARKRTYKKKEIVPFDVQQGAPSTSDAPKINIIRHVPFPSTSSQGFRTAPTRPRILNSKEGVSVKQETTDGTGTVSSSVKAVRTRKLPQRRGRTKKISGQFTPSGLANNNIVDESDLPQLGAMVTIVSEDIKPIMDCNNDNDLLRSIDTGDVKFIHQGLVPDLEDYASSFRIEDTLSGSQVDDAKMLLFPLDEVDEQIVGV